MKKSSKKGRQQKMQTTIKIKIDAEKDSLSS